MYYIILYYIFQIFEDDVYGDIVIDHPLIVKIIKTRQFQRLKDIKQLGKFYYTKIKFNSVL